MRRIKARKPRSKKQPDTIHSENAWFCGDCMSGYCDSRSDEMTDKIARRRKEGVHFSCGNNPCTCKSRGDLESDIYV